MSAAQVIQNPLLDKKLINAFIDGVKMTLSTMAQTNTVCGKPFIETDFKLRGDIAGMVGMVAPPMKGTLIISFPKESIFLIIKNMIGEEYTEITTDVSDAVGELTNMIYGSAKTSLNQMGYNFEMAIPTIVRGDFVISKTQVAATLVIPFQLENKSEFYIEITVS
ncbi:MAG: chemotaxis protein CheX [Bdellovibrionales bacterium]|jgi:chemotaxis protein CheX|nr:chemotaxis protein CheX [Bdellovibrionales bacterium]